MADTASNQGKAIATKGTAHISRTAGPTDVCLNPPVPATAPFANFVPTTRLGAGQTIRTKIDNQPIWTTKGVVGPLSDPTHPPFVVGNVSGKPYQMEAKPITGSTNVFAEGGGLIRTNDPTFQNAMNTTGFVDGSAVAGNATNEQGFLEKSARSWYSRGRADMGASSGFRRRAARASQVISKCFRAIPSSSRRNGRIRRRHRRKRNRNASSAESTRNGLPNALAVSLR